MTTKEWTQITLGEILTLEYGVNLPEASRTGVSFPVYGSNGIVGRHHDYVVGCPGIIVGRKGTVGSVVWSHEPFWPIDTTYYVKLKTNVNLRFIFWYLSSLPLRSLDSSTGVPGINRNDVYRLAITIPSNLDEQWLIAKILDTLDETIAHTTSIIAKLKQIKAGLLHDLLTRGLDENGELRDAIAHPEKFQDSPLGLIPKNWKIINIGELGSWSGGATPSKLMASNWDEGNILWISPKDFQEAEITDSEDKITEKALISSSLKLFKPGDVIVVFRSSILRHKFPVAVVKVPFTVNQDIKVLQPNLGVCRQYVFYALQHIAPQIISSAVKAGTTVESVDFKTFCNLPLFLPPETEQESIIQILDIHDTRIRTEETYLEKLKLQKKGLMDDLLTGRVRVNTSQKISA
jgi:type I restriction enzyme, S subunit